MLLVTAPAVIAGQVGWAHQAAGFQSNGAVTVKSLAGGSYAGMQNPTGAVAKPNQSASTQGPTVIIQATSGGNAPVMMWTANVYNGNLGGLAGADAKCSAEFGSGWKFAELGKLISGVPPTLYTPDTAYIHIAGTNNCSNWTSSTPGNNGKTIGMSSGDVRFSANFGGNCASTYRLACINY